MSVSSNLEAGRLAKRAALIPTITAHERALSLGASLLKLLHVDTSGQVCAFIYIPRSMT